MNEMPDVIMPSSLPPPTTWFSGQVSFQACISANFWRNCRWASRAYAGIITRDLMSRSKLAALGTARPATRPHGRIAVTNSSGDSQQHRDPPALGNLDGREQKIISFLGIRRLEHGDAGRHGVAAVVLFVLARGHAGVISRDHHQRSAHPGVGGGKERIRGNIQAHVLHRGHGARAPPKAAPMATSSATFSFGDHCARPPSSEKTSRISVDGVPG